ncbi:hypothetical protein LCGC14_2190610 [marine sediment metagenome]|uniref:PEP-CTERM protein-sorting domain-containing protein n=1 Tax=marine sediment metagenome TaxID=412755 RepID=A0A0F9FX16_9ZZZZ
MRRFVLALAIVAMLGAISQAGIILDDWTLNLAGTDGTLTGVYEGIDELSYGSAINHVTVTKAAGNTNPWIETGDTARTEGLIYIDTLKDTNGTYTSASGPPYGVIGVPGYGTDWEITAKFEANFRFEVVDDGGTPLDPTDDIILSFHDAVGTDTYLEIYVDEFGAGSGGVAANPFTGLGFDDGDLILRLQDTITGESNVLSMSSGDGADDGTFLYTDALTADGFFMQADVLYTADGVDDGMVTDPPATDLYSLTLSPDFFGIVVETDENFDVSDYNPGGGTSPPSSWTTVFSGSTVVSPNTFLNFFAQGEGSAEVGVIPEPASMVVWGLLMACLAGVALRRRMR